MRTDPLRMCLFCLLASTLASWFTPSAPAKEASPPASLAELTRQASHTGVPSNLDRRRQLLQQVAKQNPNDRLARWHLGWLRVDGQSVTIDPLTDHPSVDFPWVDYQRLGDAALAGPEHKISLAKWCARRDRS